MKQVLVRYKVKADRAEENAIAVRAVYAELQSSAPANLRYATLRGADGVTFVHYARVDTEDGVNPLLALAAFRRFSDTIKDRCEEAPISMQMDEVGSYRMFEPAPWARIYRPVSGGHVKSFSCWSRRFAPSCIATARA